jgi:hypothetical protein
MIFLKRIFASKELKVALGVIDELDLFFSKQTSIGGNGFEIIKNELTEFVTENEATLIKFYNNGQSPRVSVLYATADFVKRQLSSGQYNIYRGVLNPLREGPSLQSIYHKIANLLVKEGTLTEDDAQYSKEQLEKIISEVG